MEDLKQQIIDLLREKGALRRPDMVQYLKRPRTTIYGYLKKLMREGLVKRFSDHDGTIRRPFVYWEIIDSNVPDSRNI